MTPAETLRGPSAWDLDSVRTGHWWQPFTGV
ncbi:hypothetical protein J2S63_003733 [Marmoricola bigeumensis]|jgi:hypothetical protein|uniref:Uncharacterized protein n=1 Tax=Nocardioides marmoribigeumensis TaxID=433649 RepID=A0ABU2C0J4_9ACTN|nr:hypothetical protein [Nocardioides marmoribigeumensis]